MTPEEAQRMECDPAVDPRTRATVKLIREVCEEELKRGVGDFSVKWIGQVCASRGGICADSIANQKKYRALIAGFAARVVGKIKPLSTRDRVPEQEFAWIDRIDDPVAHRNAVSLCASFQRLRNRQTLTSEQTQHALALTTQGWGDMPVLAGSRALDLLPVEWDALRKMRDPDQLRMRGIQEDHRGQWHTADGEKLTPPGFGTALDKFLEMAPKKA